MIKPRQTKSIVAIRRKIDAFWANFTGRERELLALGDIAIMQKAKALGCDEIIAFELALMKEAERQAVFRIASELRLSDYQSNL